MKINDAAMPDISVILVGPQGDANIGACARAMKNFGLTDLRLVGPVRHKTKPAYTWAVDAKDVLEGATVFHDLDDALGDISYAVAFTRRLGRTRKRHMPLRIAAKKIADMARRRSVALIFGQEDCGLSNEDIGRADIVVTIPTSQKLPSINLAQAAIIACYEIFTNRTEGGKSASSAKKSVFSDRRTWQFAPRAEIDPLIGKLSRALSILSYEDSATHPLKSKIINQFKKLFGRAGLTKRDIRMFEGLLARIESMVSSDRNRN